MFTGKLSFVTNEKLEHFIKKTKLSAKSNKLETDVLYFNGLVKDYARKLVKREKK